MYTYIHLCMCVYVYIMYVYILGQGATVGFKKSSWRNTIQTLELLEP